jgi:hypothetical protein
VDFAAIERELAEREETFRRWDAPRRAAWDARTKAGQARGEFPLRELVAEQREIQEESLARSDPWAESLAFFESVCEEYLDACAADRERCRALFHRRADRLALLEGCAGRFVERLRSTRDARWLSLALGAVSLENFCRDLRDDLLRLADWWVIAEELGIDPEPRFERVAAISSDAPFDTFGYATRADVFRSFKTTAVLAARRRDGPRQ